METETRSRQARNTAPGWAAFGLLSAGLLLGAWQGWLPLSITEALSFFTGAACVWLVAMENVWNWPVGIANSAFFLVLFADKRLFADASLQAVYIILGFLGWYWWLHGGERRTELPVTRAGTAPRGWAAWPKQLPLLPSRARASPPR